MGRGGREGGGACVVTCGDSESKCVFDRTVGFDRNADQNSEISVDNCPCSRNQSNSTEVPRS